MKKIIFIFILFLTLPYQLFSQNNASLRIYDAEFYGIRKFYSVYRYGSLDKFVFIQNGINFQQGWEPNGSGKILKYDFNRRLWYVPFNGFLNTYWCYGGSPPNQHWFYNYIYHFAVSPADTLLLVKNWYSYCGGIDGSQMIYRSTNGGNNMINMWEYYSGFNNCAGFAIKKDPSSAFKDVYLGIADIFGGLIYLSEYDGEYFLPVDTIPNLKSIQQGGFITYNPKKINFIYTLSNNTMLSTTSGTNFFSVNIPPLRDISFDLIDSSVYGAALNKIYKSVNGIIWDSLSFNDSLYSVEVNPINHNIVYAGGKLGLYRSVNHGLSFSLFNNTFLPSKKVIGLSKNSNNGDTIIVCTETAVYKVWDEAIIDRIEKISNVIPINYKIYQNYPNPFNPVTNIKFDVSERSDIIIKIFDIRGFEIVQIANGEISPGSYGFEWKAENYPSGMYFCKLTARGFSQSIKMILLK